MKGIGRFLVVRGRSSNYSETEPRSARLGLAAAEVMSMGRQPLPHFYTSASFLHRKWLVGYEICALGNMMALGWWRETERVEGFLYSRFWGPRC